MGIGLFKIEIAEGTFYTNINKDRRKAMRERLYRLIVQIYKNCE